MPLLTIVEHYVIALLKRAVLEQQEDGSVAAFVPEAPSVLAFGSDAHACARDLFDRLATWVRVSLANGTLLPVIDNIDLNSEAGQILASYHPADNAPRGSEHMYENDEELNMAFAQHGEAT